MKESRFRMVGFPLVLALLSLLSLNLITSGQQVPQHRSPLPLSPLSGGVLMARAIRSGQVLLPGRAPALPAPATLTCSPVPCALPNVQASEGGAPVNEDPIAANPRSTKKLLTGGNDFNCSNVQGFFTTSDGGATWAHHCMGSFSGGFGAGDPGVGYDRKNTAYITGVDLGTPDGSDIVYEKSTNNGATWSATAVAVRPFFSGGITDKEWLEIDTNKSSPHVNNLYISVTQFDPSSNSEITVSNSTDGGATWTTVAVDTEQFFPTVDQFSDLAIGRDGTVYVTWMRCLANGPTGDCGGTVATLMFSKSTDAGATWSTPAAIVTVNLAPDTCGAFYGCLPNTFERVSEIPAIGADTRSTGAGAGNLYVVMYNWTGTQMQVLVSTSTDNGGTWGTPVAVAPSTATHDQFFPWLNVSESGVVGVTWLDRRDDPANINYEAFAGLSTDQGSTFTDTNIASAASNPFNDGFGGGFMGDYTGNIWVEGSLRASWMDTRNGVDAQDEVGGLKTK